MVNFSVKQADAGGEYSGIVDKAEDFQGCCVSSSIEFLAGSVFHCRRFDCFGRSHCCRPYARYIDADSKQKKGICAEVFQREPTSRG